MTADESLEIFARLCAGSIARTLLELDDRIEVGEHALVEQGAWPFAGAPAPGLEANVVLDDGHAGETILLVSEAAARRLSVAADAEPDPSEDEEELARLEELHALVGRFAVRVATAVATDAGRLVGQDVPAGEPTMLRYAAPEEAGGSSEKSPHAFVVPFVVGGERGRFVQCVENAFLIRAAPRLDELAGLDEAAGSGGEGVPDEALRDVKVRVWAELGRARLPLAQAVSIPSGAVVQLDRGADDPVELFVNGRLLAHGRLVVRDGEWAVEIAELMNGTRAELVAVIDTRGPAPGGDPQAGPLAADNSPR